MRKYFFPLLAGLLMLFAVSCDRNSMYRGFDKMENGAYMKFFQKSGSGISPRLKDRVTFEMAQYFNDSLLYSTIGDEPLDIVLREADFVGDVTDGLLMMQVGDSARLVVLADSIFIAMMDTEAPEEFAGRPIYYDLKLLSIKPFEEIEKENKRLLDSMKLEEQAYLDVVMKDVKNVLDASGLIILEQKGKGKLAQMGDYVDFDFLMCSKDGDTLMNSFDVESVDMQFGEEFICNGFTTALGLVPEGGVMRFVIPSELGFDSVGYQDIILPYDPIVVKLRMNKVMDEEAHRKNVEARQAKEEAERQKRLAQELDLIKNYIETNGIAETPTESGVYIVRHEEGSGTKANWGDEVAVHYTLYNLHGDQVESSYTFGEPMHFTIGKGEMIPCIEEAVMTMSPGAKVTVISPSEHAFGEFAIHNVLLPAYSPLLVELELISIE